MLPLVLVLLVATSALAAPGVTLSVAPIESVPLPKNPGLLVSSFVTDRAFDLLDGGDANPYMLTAKSVVNDYANKPDKISQTLALGQALAYLGSAGTGLPGDACAAANFINVYSNAVKTNNYSGVNAAVTNYIGHLSNLIDLISQLASNPDSVKFRVGLRGNCNGGGRSYAFESAWDSILSGATPNTASLYNEQYCSVKRLYNAFSVRSNNVGAELTAVSLPPIQSVLRHAFEPLARFVGSLPSGGSPAAANAAKQAISSSCRHITY